MAYTLAASLLVVFATVPVLAWAETVATVAGEPISREDLEKSVRPQLIEVENNKYEILEQGLDEMVAQKLIEKEAKTRGVSVEELQKQEIESKITQPTDADAQQVYDANKAQLQGQTLDAVKPRIVEFLKEQKAAARKEAFINELKGKYKTVVNLKAPVVEVSTGGRPEKGPKDAPVTMIVFSDYECPFCRRAETTVEQVLKTYEGKIKYVFRDYPLPFHSKAKPAAVAANCAIPQGKFFEYNQKLFVTDLSPENYKKIAGDLGMDQKKFDECVAKNDEKSIDQDLADGAAVGVNGTPAFFINGRMLSGAQPFEAFKVIIDEEVAKSGSKS